MMKREHEDHGLNPSSDNQEGEVDGSHFITDAEMHFSETLNPPLIQGGLQVEDWQPSTGCNGSIRWIKVSLSLCLKLRHISNRYCKKNEALNLPEKEEF